MTFLLFKSFISLYTVTNFGMFIVRNFKESSNTMWQFQDAHHRGWSGGVIGQGPAALAEGAGRGLFGHFFSHLSFLSSFSLSLGDGPIYTEILSQRAVKP